MFLYTNELYFIYDVFNFETEYGGYDNLEPILPTFYEQLLR